MSEFTQNKTAGVFATVLIGIIILAFMFTGYQQFEGGGSVANIGSVDGMPITPEEYQTEYNRQIEFYRQIMGGDLTAKQIENMKVKESIIKNIVQRKLMSRLAKDLGTFPADEEVKAEIKALPYFQTNGQFDINRYKGLLAANKLTPLDFEKDVIDQIRLRKSQELTAQYPISKAYLADLASFKKDKLNAEIVQITKSSLTQFIDASSAEITAFLNDKTNVSRVEAIFKERSASLNKDESVTAKHILLMTQGKDEKAVKEQIEKIAKEVNASNFAKLAEKYTEDPSGKGKGGDLGTFGKGQMVPEFDQVAFNQKPGTVSAPVKTQFGYHLIFVEKKTDAVVAKLDDYRERFAKELLQKSKVEDLKKLTVDIANSMKTALESGNSAQVKSISDKYKLSYNNGTVNRIDGISTGAHVSSDNMKAMFSADISKAQFHSFDDGATMTMIRTTPPAAVAEAKTDLNTQAQALGDETGLKNVLAKKLMDSILKELEANAKVKINNNMLQM